MGHLNRSALGVALGLALWGAACHRQQPPEALAAQQQALKTALESRNRAAYGAAASDADVHVWQEAQRFYKDNNYALVWSDGRKPRGQMDALIRAIRGAEREGLDPADYRVDELDRIRQAFDQANAADSDVRFTIAYLRYAWDLSHGTVDPQDIDRHWHPASRDVDLHSTLEAALGDNRVEDSLQQLAPTAPQYQGLKHQLARHRELRVRNPGATVPVPQENAAPIQMPIADVVRTIAMNMDRWRWLPEDLGSRYLIVNIPAFHLDAIENGKSVLGMKVVTGKKGSPTPVLTDRMTTIVFSPYWNIPADIVSKEILPKLATDPNYLERNNIEADESGQRYRQRPGEGNSLGQVKFLFPNHFNVYLHDTPAEALFNRIERDFSHGCVRLERPFDLAKYVLRDQLEWTDERITAAMNSGVEQSVALKHPLPIYLVYFTAWEEHDGLQLRPDVYGHDRRLGAAVDQ